MTLAKCTDKLNISFPIISEINYKLLITLLYAQTRMKNYINV